MNPNNELDRQRLIKAIENSTILPHHRAAGQGKLEGDKSLSVASFEGNSASRSMFSIDFHYRTRSLWDPQVSNSEQSPNKQTSTTNSTKAPGSNKNKAVVNLVMVVIIVEAQGPLCNKDQSQDNISPR